MKNITTNLLSIFLCGSILHACSSSDKTLIPPSPNFEEEEIKEITLPEDIQIIPVGGKASECQPGSDIDKSYDGKFTIGTSESHYHSSWSNTSFPVTLEYFFKGDMEINYFIYYTRSGNGNFGEVEVYTSTDSARKNYTLQGTYDFKMKNDPSRIVFKEGIKATGVKFVVKSGLGNFASCDEMHFSRRIQTRH